MDVLGSTFTDAIVALNPGGSSCSIGDSRFVRGFAHCHGQPRLSSSALAASLTDTTFVDAPTTAFTVSADHPGPLSIHIARAAFLDGVSLADWSTGSPTTSGAVHLGSSRRSRITHVDVTIEDSVFDGNRGDLASHLTLDVERQDADMDVLIARTAFWRGGWLPLEGPAEGIGFDRDPNLGAVLLPSYGYGNGALHLTFDDVDLGDGPTANHGPLIAGCANPVANPYAGDLLFHRSRTDPREFCP